MSEDHKVLFISQGLNQLKKKKNNFNHILLELKVSSEYFNNRLINTNSSYNAVWIIKDYFSILLYKKLDHTLVLWLDCDFLSSPVEAEHHKETEESMVNVSPFSIHL